MSNKNFDWSKFPTYSRSRRESPAFVFPRSELDEFLEIARCALMDSDVFVESAKLLDRTDRQMIELRDKLQAYLDNK